MIYVVCITTGIAAVFSEGWNDAVSMELFYGEELAVLRGVSGGAGGGRAARGGAAAQAAPASALARLRAAQHLSRRRARQWPICIPSTACCGALLGQKYQSYKSLTAV